MSVDVHSHRVQLIITALAASVATAGLFTAYQQHSRHKKRRELDQEIRRSLASRDSHVLPSADPQKPNGTGKEKIEDAVERDIALGTKFRSADYEYDEELVREQLARNYAFFGEEGMDRIRKGTVVVVGCGGVGSWAAVMLVRSYALWSDAVCNRMLTTIHPSTEGYLKYV